MTPVVSLVADLAVHAVAGSVPHAEQAIEVIGLAARAGDQHLYVVAQHTVYDAILGRGRAVPTHLVALGAALGLAVDRVSARHR